MRTWTWTKTGPGTLLVLVDVLLQDGCPQARSTRAFKTITSRTRTRTWTWTKTGPDTLLVDDRAGPETRAGTRTSATDTPQQAQHCGTASRPECDGFGGPGLVEGTEVSEVFEARSSLSNLALGFLKSAAFVPCGPSVCAFGDQLGHGPAGPAKLSIVVAKTLWKGVQKLEGKPACFARQMPRIKPLVGELVCLLGRHEGLLGCPPNGRFTSPQAVHWAGNLSGPKRPRPTPPRQRRRPPPRWPRGSTKHAGLPKPSHRGRG